MRTRFAPHVRAPRPWHRVYFVCRGIFDLQRTPGRLDDSNNRQSSHRAWLKKKFFGLI